MIQEYKDVYISSALYGVASEQSVLESALSITGYDNERIYCKKRNQEFSMTPEQFANSYWIRCPINLQLTLQFL